MPKVVHVRTVQLLLMHANNFLITFSLQVSRLSHVCELFGRHDRVRVGCALAQTQRAHAARPLELGKERRVRPQSRSPRHVRIRRQYLHVGHKQARCFSRIQIYILYEFNATKI